MNVVTNIGEETRNSYLYLELIHVLKSRGI